MLGVCLGLQVAVIEFARNVLGWEGEDTRTDQHRTVDSNRVLSNSAAFFNEMRTFSKWTLFTWL